MAWALPALETPETDAVPMGDALDCAAGDKVAMCAEAGWWSEELFTAGGDSIPGPELISA